MSDKTELQTVNMNQLPVMGLGANLDTLTTLVQSVSYLKRIQLYTKGKAVDTGKIPPGSYGVPSADAIKNLGSEIDILPLVVRAKAIDSKDKDAIIITWDETSDEYLRIKEESEEKDSKCMYGFSFLVYERSTAEYYELFFCNASQRNEASNVTAFLPRTPEQEAELTKELGRAPTPSGPCTLRTKYVTKGDWGWHVPVTSPCSTPFKGFDPVQAAEQMTKFVEQKDTSIEKAPEPTSKRAH